MCALNLRDETPMKLDKIDYRILSALAANARITMLALADKVGLSKTPCQRRVHMLEEAGVIRGYTVAVDTQKIGINVCVFASVEFNQMDPGMIADFEALVERSPEISECYVTTGTSDFLVKIVAPDFAHYENFLKTKLLALAGIRRINTTFAYRSVKDRSSVIFSTLGG